jgi:hypothetical protein
MFQIFVGMSFYNGIAKLTKRQPKVPKEIAVNANRTTQRQAIKKREVSLLGGPHLIGHTGEPTAIR